MFGRILKKDLKRKKTVNLILLLFVIMSSMFAASSVNNIIAVTSGLDFYLDKAEVGDYIALTKEDLDFEEILADIDGIDKIKIEEGYGLVNASGMTINGDKKKNKLGELLVTGDTDTKINYFDPDNNVITEMEAGTFYGNPYFVKRTEMQPGDKMTLTSGSRTVELEYKGILKDAMIGSVMVDLPHILISKSDLDELTGYDDSEAINVKSAHIFTENTDAVETALKNEPITFQGTRGYLKFTYVMNMMVAGILMIASAGLVLTSFAMLNFTIKSTINEEFREIGVMKAVGIDSGSIRRLYLIKYLALAVAGAAIGFVLSIPLGDMLLRSVSTTMYIGSGSRLLVGGLCSAGVVAVILLFCYSSTARIKKLSPIDAVRDGQTGERYGKKSHMHLGRSRLGATGFLALNDVLSAPKQYGMMTAIFTILMLMISVVSNFSYTIRSETFIPVMGVAKSDAYYSHPDGVEKIMTEEGAGEKISEDVEKTLAGNGMPADCSLSYYMNYKIRSDEKETTVRFLIDREIPNEAYEYNIGTAPSAPDEIAVAEVQLKELGAKVGDHITVVTSSGEKDFIITASFYSLNNLGHVARLYNGFEFSPEEVGGCMGMQIDFDGDPDKETIEKNIERMREIFNTEDIYNASDFVALNTGVSDMLYSVKILMTVIMIIVAALMSVLIERSFITKEKSEIALMKATGTTNGSVIAHHTLRFTIVGLAVYAISSALISPISSKAINALLSLISGDMGVKTACQTVDVFVVSPMILIAVLTIGAFLTALYTRTITSSDTASIE